MYMQLIVSMTNVIPKVQYQKMILEAADNKDFSLAADLQKELLEFIATMAAETKDGHDKLNSSKTAR